METATYMFRRMTDPNEIASVMALIEQLYLEDPPGYREFQLERCMTTLDEFLNHPASGSVVLICWQQDVVGYALLVPYWSNEFGGRLLFIDELFLGAGHRRKGVGRAFLEHLNGAEYHSFVGQALEVSPGNTRARKLYESCGFSPRTHQLMVRTRRHSTL